MPTELLERPAKAGAPYRVGDLLEVENGNGQWVEVRVKSVEYDGEARFGCHWKMTVTTTGLFSRSAVIHVDDNGCNFTITRRVRPSEWIED